jgi:hypothetical protein
MIIINESSSGDSLFTAFIFYIKFRDVRINVKIRILTRVKKGLLVMPAKLYLSTKIIRLYLVIALVFSVASYIYYLYISKYMEKEIGYYSEFITKQFCDNFQTTLNNVQLDVFGKYSINVLLSKNVSKEIVTGADAYSFDFQFSRNSQRRQVLSVNLFEFGR